MLRAKEYASRNRMKRSWQKIVRFMACIVVFCTTYALILPAITLEYADICQKEEHIHTIECYEQVSSQQITTLSCTYETLGVHEHKESCYDGRDLICNQVDFAVHSHDGSCYDEEGLKICALPEIKEHRHEKGCYQIPEADTSDAHTHTDGCYEWLKGEKLVCTESTEGHTHNDGCYSVAEAPLCGMEESDGHTHGESCNEKTLFCTESTDPHVHMDTCFTTERTKICTLEESSHTHEATCYDEAGTLICSQEEGRHIHTEDCYTETRKNLCDLEEGSGHTHTEECYQMVLICTLVEIEGHTHTTGCYKERTCGLEEFAGHQHTDTCYEQVRGELICGFPEEPEPTEPPIPELICEKSEILLHKHKGTCYTYTESGEAILICEKLEILEHMHTADCFTTETIPVDTESLTCLQEESETHTHTRLCYGTWNLICEKEEHTHTEECRVLTEEEKIQIENAETAITALPEAETISGELETFAGARDLSGWEAAFQTLQTRLQEARSMYESVPQLLRPVVANDEKLLALEELSLVLMPPAMTEEEKSMVDGLTAQLERLPLVEDIQAQLEAISGEKETLLTELTIMAQKIRTQYERLNDLQQRSVTNLDRLTALEALLKAEQEKSPVYYCGKETHTHAETCYDAEGSLICTLVEHIHTDECTVEPVLTYFCGKEAHTHAEVCYDAEEILICTLQEHTHTEACTIELTEAERAQVNDVISLIDGLPTVEEIAFNFADLEAAGKLEELAAYRDKILASVTAAFDGYNALTEQQKLAVTNAEKLMKYRYLVDDKTLQGSAFTASTEDGSITANVVTENILPEGITFQISLAPDFADAAAQASAFLKNLNRELVDMLVLDMHFVDGEGNEYKVEGVTEVTLSFADPLLLSDGEICALHILDSGAVDVLKKAERTESETTRITIETESFSQFLFGLTRQTPGKSLSIGVAHKLDEAATEKDKENFQKTQYVFQIPGLENQILSVRSADEQSQSIALDEKGCFTLQTGQNIVLEDIGNYFGEKQTIIGLIPKENGYLYSASINSVGIETPGTVMLNDVEYLGYQTEIDLSGDETEYTVEYCYIIDTSRMGLLEISNILIGTKPADEIVFPVQILLDSIPVTEGTKFLVQDETNAETQQYLFADANGVINLKAPQRVRMAEHIKPGTTYSVQLFAPVENWLMTYTGLEGTPTNTGVILESGTSGVTLYSGPADSETEIPVTVQFLELTADDQLERISTIKMTQVKDSLGTPLAEEDPKIPEELPDTVLTCTGSEPQMGKITIGYPKETEPGLYYYQIVQSEIAEVATVQGRGNIPTPDTSVYIAEVTVGTTEEGIPSASVTALWKNGEQVLSEEDESLTVVFRNQWVVYELPKTGGIGTSMYLFVGWIMIICGFVLMNFKRKNRKGAA